MTILKPIALFILILCTILVVAQSKNVQPNNSNSNDLNLIEETCKKTPNYALCIQYLKPYPGSSEATVNGLAIIMFRIMEHKAIETKSIIGELLAKLDPRDPFRQRVPLTECSDIYDSIMRADAMNGADDLLRAPTNVKDAEFRGNDAKNRANICEHKFHGGGYFRTPLTDNNNIMKDIGILTATIVTLI